MSTIPPVPPMPEPVLDDDIFRAYDIRGIVGKGLNAAVMGQLGLAIGSEALDLGETSLVVGADARLSSPEFHRAMIEGVLATGCDVIDIGTVPSPLLYFATHTLGAKSGIMITGSHNPADYNGVKIVLRQQCLADQQIQHLKTRIQQQVFRQGVGQLSQYDLRDDYIKRICQDIVIRPPDRAQSPKVVIDAGNGATGHVAPLLFRTLGCEVVELYCDADGRFPHHHPDPTVAANLRDLISAVAAEQADLGIAFDGDGDRVGLVTASGRILDADKLLMSFVADILPDNPGATVVFDVKSSFHLAQLVNSNGGQPVMCKSGHSFVKRKIQETNALIGGEYSAHIFFKHRWYGFDDGLYTAARFLELMTKYNCSADVLLDRMPASVSTAELGISVPEQHKFDIMAEIAANISLPAATINRLDGIRADFQGGWGLLRASNTTLMLVCRFEAEDEAMLADIQAAFRTELQRLAPRLKLPF